MLLLRDSSRVGPAAQVLQGSHFRDPVYRELFDWLKTGENVPEKLSPEGREQMALLQGEHIEFGEGDRAFDDIVGDILIAPLMIELRKLQRTINGPLDEEDRQNAVRRKQELRARLNQMGTELSRIGFKTTRYRALRARVEKPSNEQSE